MISTRNAPGVNTIGFIAPPVAYSTDADYGDFIANAVAGEIGVFLESLALKTTALTAGDKFFIAQKQADGQIKKTPLYTFGVASKAAYQAPVKKVSYIGYDGGVGTLNLAAIAKDDVFDYIISLIDGTIPTRTGGNGYTASATDSFYEVMAGLLANADVASFQSSRRYPLLADLAVVVAGTYATFTLGGVTPTATFTKDSRTITLGGTTPVFNGVVGDFIGVNPTGAPTAGLADVYKIVAVSAGVSVTLDRVYTGETVTFTQAEVQGTRVAKITAVTDGGLRFTGKNAGENFSLSKAGALEDATINYKIGNAVLAVRGVGTPEQAKEAERFGDIYDGKTAVDYPISSDWQTNGTFAAEGETYDSYNMDYINEERASPPFAYNKNTLRFLIMAAKSGTNPNTALTTIFGV